VTPPRPKNNLGWVPKISLDEMVQEMVAHDLDQARQHALLKSSGYKVSVGRE
jgi:GDPmannose 4,6-dehydratase